MSAERNNSVAFSLLLSLILNLRIIARKILNMRVF